MRAIRFLSAPPAGAEARQVSFQIFSRVSALTIQPASKSASSRASPVA